MINLGAVSDHELSHGSLVPWPRAPHVAPPHDPRLPLYARGQLGIPQGVVLPSGRPGAAPDRELGRPPLPPGGDTPGSRVPICLGLPAISWPAPGHHRVLLCQQTISGEEDAFCSLVRDARSAVLGLWPAGRRPQICSAFCGPTAPLRRCLFV